MKTYNELRAEFDKLKQAIDVARESEAERLAARVLMLLLENGVDILWVADSVVPQRRARKRPQPKYWNPETGATWSGRGRVPLWLVGKNLDDFRIPSDDSSG